jgi:membrane protein DedA with SNARE-associated domain
MLNINPDALITFLVNYGYWALFIGMVIEGPVITILGGFLTSLGFFKVQYVYIIILLGDVIGDSIAYTIGYFGRKRILVKVFGWLQINEDKLLGIEEFFKQHGGKSVFISKFIAGAGSWTLITAGISRMNLKRFYTYSIGGGIIKSAIYIGIGLFFGGMYKIIIQWMDIAGTVALLIIIAGIILYILKKLSKKDIKKLSKRKKRK